MSYKVFKRDSSGNVKVGPGQFETQDLGEFLNGLPVNEKPIFISEKEIVIQVN